MNSLPETLAQALDRVADFNAVQRGRGADELADAVNRLQESVGVDDEARAILRDRLAALPGAGPNAGPVLLGIIVGLMAAQLAAEADSEGELALSD